MSDKKPANPPTKRPAGNAGSAQNSAKPVTDKVKPPPPRKK